LPQNVIFFELFVGMPGEYDFRPLGPGEAAKFRSFSVKLGFPSCHL